MFWCDFIAWRKPNPMIPKIEVKKTHLIIDYLKQFEEKRAKKGIKPDLYYINKQLKKSMKNDQNLTPKRQYADGNHKSL